MLKITAYFRFSSLSKPAEKAKAKSVSDILRLLTELAMYFLCCILHIRTRTLLFFRVFTASSTWALLDHQAGYPGAAAVAHSSKKAQLIKIIIQQLFYLN